MLTKLRLVFSITMVFLSFYASAQSKYWEKEVAHDAAVDHITKQFNIEKGEIFSFREKLFKQDLKASMVSRNRSRIVYFPDFDGNPVAYQINEAPVLSPQLAAKYPQIKSYAGYAVNNSKDKIRFSVSAKDIQAMIVHADGRPNSFVQKAVDNTYIMYSRSSLTKADSNFLCSTKEGYLAQNRNSTAKPVDGQILRKYRLAISATAEYTAYHGGTVEGALAAINATITRVNEVFETDLAVRLELIADTEKIIYTDPDTDPYSGGTSELGNVGQNVFTNEIGEANYDVGHVLHQGINNGNAGFIGAICEDNRKGSAYSSGQDPKGDIFDFDFVAHEIGHQLGANHTWSYELEGTLVQVEPGSGTTIMGYAGIANSDNVSLIGDNYFHYLSIDQISDNLKSKSCGEVLNISNNPPVIAPIKDYIIPKSTAFMLTGGATDADADDVLTYTWEQIDNGVVTAANFGPTNPVGANFRSRPPTANPSRYFPMLQRVLAGNLTQANPTVGSAWETVSDVEREMNFAFTVRDNAEGGGQVVSELMNIKVVNTPGPFAVTSQATNETFLAGSTQTIVWDVAGTDSEPLNILTVDILLSTDGGLTFPTVLASEVVNDGSHKIIVPNMPTSEARIMVKPMDNVFYAVNSTNFAIEASEIVLNFSNVEFEVCHFENLKIPFIYETYLGFNEEVSFSVTDAPGNLDFYFTPGIASSNGTEIELFLGDTENVPEGTYPIKVTAASASYSKEVVLDLTVYDAEFLNVELLAPANEQTDVSTRAVMHWEQNTSFSSVEIQIATDAAFNNIVEVADLNTNCYSPNNLESETTYFWRIKPKTNCREGAYGEIFSFTTVAINCETKGSRDLPLAISHRSSVTVQSKIELSEDLHIDDIKVNLNISHSYLSDLIVSLISPAGTKIRLISNSCGDLKNVDVTFDDNAEDFVCGEDADNAIKGKVKPLGSLSAFVGESTLGEWILEIEDNASSDGGSLNSFSLDICAEGTFRPDADNDGVFDDGEDLCLGTPEGLEVNSTGCPVYRFPTDNFIISVESESCRTSDDGVLSIEAIWPLDYEISVSKDSFNVTDNFTPTSYMLQGLSSGTYTICINGSDGTLDYEEYCLEIVVAQPEPLQTTSVISEDGNLLSLSMMGGSSYTIELNGEIIKTDKTDITLNLKSGNNVWRVSTDLACQGEFEEKLFVGDRPIVFPNPFDAHTQVFLGVQEEVVAIDIFTQNGQLVKSGPYKVAGQEVNLDFYGLPSGMYFVKLKGEKVTQTLKVIKR